MRHLAITCALLFSLSAVTAQAAPISKHSLERRTFKLVNQHRTATGLEKLTWNTHVAYEARQHSKDMAHGRTAFGHDGFADRITAIQSYFPQLRSAGENVAYTTSSSGVARQIVDLWLNSEGHRENIEGTDYTVSGMGVGKSGHYYYLTQIFIENN